MAKKKGKTFTFEIPSEFEETFNKFQTKSGEDERSIAANIRFLIRKDVESEQVAG